MGADIAFLKGESPRLQEAFRLGTRTTAGFRVEMNFHLQEFPTREPLPLVPDLFGEAQLNSPRWLCICAKNDCVVGG